MSLNKAIKYGKEKRKPYRGGKAVAYSCRNHGGCKWCEGNRLHSSKVREEKYKDMKELENEVVEVFRENLKGMTEEELKQVLHREKLLNDVLKELDGEEDEEYEK